MRHILFLLFMAFTLQAIAQYPATGNKMRLGWQTTGDGLVYRGAIGDTATLDPSGLNNAWMLLDTANGNLYAYRAKAWRLVSGGGGGGGLTMPFDSVTFNVNETDASLRELKYSEEKGYLQYGGQDSVQIPLLPGIWYVRNDTSVTIPKGTVLRATGTLGASGRIKVKHMIANGSVDAMYILGIAMQDIAVGADGYAMSQGKIRKINTQAYSEGAVLYADVDTLGGLTQTEPTGSNLKLPIAFVVNSASNGTIAVRVTSGAYMRDLHDAEITSPASNASLYYNAAQGVWRDTGAAVLVADTTVMLSPYLKKTDTTSLSNRINTKLNISDTSVFARDFQISGTTNRLAMFTGSNTVGNSWFSQSDSVMTLNDTKKMQLYGRNGRRNYLEIFRGGTNIMQTNYVLATDTAYTASTGTTSRVYTHAVDNQNADYMISTYSGGGTGGYILLDAARTAVGLNNPVNRLDVEGAAAIGATYAGLFTAPTNGLLVEGNVGIATSSPSRPLHVAGTTAIRIPVGNLAERGTSGAGDIRVRNDTANLEFHNGTSWQTVINNSDTSVFARDVQISGTTNYIPKFTGANTIGNSGFIENGQEVYLGGTTNAFNLSRFSIYYNPVNNGFPIVADTRAYNASPLPGAGWNFGGKKDSTGAYTAFGAIQGAKETSANSEAGYLQFSTNSDGGSTFPEERMRITSAGNVGIGTASPSRPLHVAGTTAIRIPSGNLAQRGTSDNGDIRVRTDTASMEYYSGAWRTVAPMARVPQSGLANRFSKFDANGLLDTSAVLVQDADKAIIRVNNSSAQTSSDTTLYVNGWIKSNGYKFENGALNNAIATLYRFTGSSISSGGVTPFLGILNARPTPVQNLNFNLYVFSDVQNGRGQFQMWRARGSESSPSAVQVDDWLGQFGFSGFTSSGQNDQSATLRAVVDSTVSAGSIPTRLVMSTGTSLANSSERLVIKHSGKVGIGVSTPQNLLDLEGEMVIGRSYSGTNTAPANGLLVQGETYIGTTTDNGSYNLQVGGNIKATGNISRKSAIVTTSNYTVLDEDTWITCVGSNRITLTLPSASTWPGREIVVQTGTAFGVVSNSSNVHETSSVYSFPDTSIIKADYPYAWVKLVSDGTGWIKIQRSPYIITKSITLDFPAVAAQSSYTFSNTFVGGASIGDVVSIGVPSGMPANTIFTGQVSTTDGTVDIKMHNYGTTTTANPPSATFKIAITKF